MLHQERAPPWRLQRQLLVGPGSSGPDIFGTLRGVFRGDEADSICTQWADDQGDDDVSGDEREARMRRVGALKSACSRGRACRSYGL